jgi:hypothetical protein
MNEMVFFSISDFTFPHFPFAQITVGWLLSKFNYRTPLKCMYSIIHKAIARAFLGEEKKLPKRNDNHFYAQMHIQVRARLRE